MHWVGISKVIVLKSLCSDTTPWIRQTENPLSMRALLSVSISSLEPPTLLFSNNFSLPAINTSPCERHHAIPFLESSFSAFLVFPHELLVLIHKIIGMQSALLWWIISGKTSNSLSSFISAHSVSLLFVASEFANSERSQCGSGSSALLLQLEMGEALPGIRKGWWYTGPCLATPRNNLWRSKMLGIF